MCNFKKHNENINEKRNEIHSLRKENAELYNKVIENYNNKDARLISFNDLLELKSKQWIYVNEKAEMYVRFKSKLIIIIIFKVKKSGVLNNHKHDCRSTGKVTKGRIVEVLTQVYTSKKEKFKTAVNEPHSYVALEDSTLINIYHKC